MDTTTTPVGALNAIITETQGAQRMLLMIIARVESLPQSRSSEAGRDAIDKLEAELHRLYVRLGRLLDRAMCGIPEFEETQIIAELAGKVVDSLPVDLPF